MSFSFEQITRSLGRSEPRLTAAEIAQRWSEVRRYTCDQGDCNDHQRGTIFPSLKDLGLAAAASSSYNFGFEGSIGASRGPAELKSFQGLSDGFTKL